MKTLVFFVVLVVALPGFADEAASFHPLFFAAEKNGHTAYIFGTYHMFPVKEVPASVLNKIASSSVFMSERTYTKVADEKTVPAPAQPLPEPPAPNADTVEKIVQRGVPREVVAKASGSSLCGVYLFWESIQNVIAQGGILDLKLEQLAKSQNKLFVQLDSDETSAQAMKSVADVCDINSMTVEMPPQEARAFQDEQMAKYRAGDLKDFANADKEGSLGLVGERNKEWAPEIEENLSKGDAFVAVGVSHLGGQHGLLNVLAERGFTVRRIDSVQQMP